jgi:hypothetical protein
MARRIRCAARMQRMTTPEARGDGLPLSSDCLISLARCRELLADEGLDLSDEELDHVRRHAAAMARVLVLAFLENRSTVD